jgi:nitroimidazol reductase NimA-like FMN-containing flavoprotein (pyridoxamine 5'-phosphate oxidase superfamily)
MRDHTAIGTAHAPTAEGRGDLGHRIVQRRTELGLARPETARRAGMAVSYLRYLEETPAATPGRSVLLRLAGALETSVTALTGGDTDLPAGLGPAGRHPESTALGLEECLHRLHTHGVGRLAVTTAEGPTVLPVNYSVIDGAIVFRTATGSTAEAAIGKQVAFEVDHIDGALGRGWSVLVRGRARGVTEPQAVRRLAEGAYSEPWAGGEREVWVCIEPDTVSGRAIG